jgi:tRNA nucleotidyltransferase (CCA-adding enzyme)
LTTRDLDVVVEGDGLAVARALATAVGLAPGGLIEHARFLTASLAARGRGRVDIATARSERYETPGALPRVMPASIGEDLGRRDFTINAMAVELASGGFGVLDPLGGRTALARRRITILHPLSFVEDPTRIFRAARYAARLGFTLDAWTMRAVGLALRLAPYPALSGQRLAAELALIIGDRRPDAALRHLGSLGAFRLLAADYRFTQAIADRARRLPAALAWCRAYGVTPSPLEIAAVTILSAQAPAIARVALDRLVITGEPRARLERALTRPATPAARSARASDRARPWWALNDVELLAAWLTGGTARRDVGWFVGTARPRRPALGGDDIVALGVAAGPRVAVALRALRDARLDRRVTDRDSEVEFVQDFLSRKEG